MMLSLNILLKNLGVWVEQIEPLYLSMYSVIFHRTILLFLLGYSNCLEPRMPDKPYNAEKACITKNFEYPYGANPLYCRLSRYGK